MNINLVGIQDSIKILKLCILYFDDINIEIPWFYDSNSSFHLENNFTDQLIYLKNFFDVRISFLEFDMPCFKNNRNTSECFLDIIINNADFIYENIIVKENYEIIYGCDTKIRNKEFKEFILQTYELYVNYVNNLFSPYESSFLNSNIGLIDYSNDFLEYYLSNLFLHVKEKESFISDLQIINDLIGRSLKKEKMFLPIKDRIDLNGVSILLPDLSYATFDDIYEMKIKMRDELLELQAFINSLSSDIDIENIKHSEEVIINKINKAIKNLEFKMKNIKINTVQKFISEIKNPLSYAPLIGSLFIDIPTNISLFSSIGLIGVNTGLEYVKQLNNIKRDSMYFLFKLRKQ